MSHPFEYGAEFSKNNLVHHCSVLTSCLAYEDKVMWITLYMCIEVPIENECNMHIVSH